MKNKYILLLVGLLFLSVPMHSQSSQLETIGNNAFDGANIGQGMSLPPSLKSIGSSAFQGITIPCLDFTQARGLEQILSNAFYGAILTSYNVLDLQMCVNLRCYNTSNINGGSFAGFEGKVLLPFEMAQSLHRNSLTSIGTNAFEGLKLTDNPSLDLSKSHQLLRISNQAFLNSDIKEVTLPDSLQYIGDNTFSGCNELSKITSYNAVPPSLGSTVFEGVDTLTCKLRVPEEGLDAYSIADQWKSFLNRKVIGTVDTDEYEKGKEDSVYIFIPTDGNGVEFRPYDFDNPDAIRNSGIVKTYKTIDIGEHTWTTDNLKLKNEYHTWMNFTQTIIDEKLGNNTIPVAQFENIYGTWASLYPKLQSYRERFLVYDQKDGNLQQGWSLPDMTDFAQMFGQAPVIYEDNAVFNIMNFMGANQKDIPGGHTLDWYKYSNTSGFTMTPLGWRQSSEKESNGELWENFGYESGFRLKEPYTGKLRFGRIDGVQQIRLDEFYHLSQVRYVRSKTDKELGYKLYVNSCTDEVIKIPLENETRLSEIAAGLNRNLILKGSGQEITLNVGIGESQLTELPRGLERGIALRYADRKENKFYKKWSEIVSEGKSIREQLKNILPTPELPPSECIPQGNMEYRVLETGTVENLSFYDSDENKLDLNVTWLSSNPAVGVIENNNNIRLIEEGVMILSVIWEDGRKSDLLEITVTVRNPEEPEVPTPPSGVSTDQNYIRTITYMDESGDEDKALDNIQYFDGLGRPMQTVQRAITPDKRDLVTHQEYDAFGREAEVWLPVLSDNGGAFVSPDNNNIESLAKTQYSDSNPYSEPIYEASPLNRILKQYGPGEKWRSDVTKGSAQMDYLTNNNSNSDLSCILYTVGGTRKSPSLEKGSNPYTGGELYVTKTTNEEGHISYEFKDKLGQVVLTRQINNNGDKTSERLDTYYVYDDFGNLCYVLPPLAAGADKNETDILDQCVYQYKYDERNRQIAKKLPGADWIYNVYDKADRPILSQDGELRREERWIASVPDALGRIAVTAIYESQVQYDQAPLNDLVVKAEYTDSGYLISGLGSNIGSQKRVLSENFYDSYRFLEVNNLESLKYDNSQETNFGKRYTGGYAGQQTGASIAIMDDSQSGVLYTAMYYDNRGRVIQTRSTNHLGGVDIEYIAYNFTGQPINKMIEHRLDGKITSELYTYSYDHAGRLKTTHHSLNGGADVILASNNYDNLGRLKSTESSNQSKLKTDYAYNIRSWTKSITNPLYTQSMDYTLSGNVDWMKWSQNGQGEKEYQFGYDDLSRLTEAVYSGDGQYGTTYTYDMHGNIKTLTRQGVTSSRAPGEIDNLTFKYTGNQLYNVKDEAAAVLRSTSYDFKDKAGDAKEYAFNKNGAMVQDLNKGIETIQYNYLNLPQAMVINSVTAKGKNYYTYSASGVKLKTEQRYDPDRTITPMISTNPSNDGLSSYKITNYVGNIVYEESKDGETVSKKTRILIDGGYIEDGRYHFYLKDHLGNNRIVADSNGNLIQSNEYYPFGMSYASDINQDKQAYKYNGKEFDDMHGLNQYDYSARYYDPAVPRFTSIDPLAEKFYNWSPYVYVYNNPLKFIDPDGKAPWFIPFVIKGIIGAGTDAVAQVTVHMANDIGFVDAVKKIDMTSVTASFITSAITSPGMSTASKGVVAAAIATDALVDINTEEGVNSVMTGDKPISSAGLDAASSIIPGKAVDKLTSKFTETVVSDLAASSASVLNKGEKATMKKTVEIINSTGFQMGANSTVEYGVKSITGQINKAINNISQEKIVQPNDAIKIEQKKIYE